VEAKQLDYPAWVGEKMLLK